MRHYLRFGHHKCLTQYFKKIMPFNHHFMDDKERFVKFLLAQKTPQFMSLNNKTLNPEREIFSESKMYHLIRHPKDLIVSGYFYHKRGTEIWTHDKIPYYMRNIYALELQNVFAQDEIEWIKSRPTLCELLTQLDFDKGMMLEIVWRKFQCGFNPVPYYESDAVRTYRFEDIMEDPRAQFNDICDYLEVTDEIRRQIMTNVIKLENEETEHIRDKSADQYVRYFTRPIEEFFDIQFPRVVELLGYDNTPAKL